LPGRTAASAPSDATAVVAAMLIAFRASVCLVPGSSGRATCCGARFLRSNDCAPRGTKNCQAARKCGSDDLRIRICRTCHLDGQNDETTLTFSRHDPQCDRARDPLEHAGSSRRRARRRPAVEAPTRGR
jgi:hypothetical protein